LASLSFSLRRCRRSSMWRWCRPPIPTGVDGCETHPLFAAVHIVHRRSDPQVAAFEAERCARVATRSRRGVAPVLGMIGLGRERPYGSSNPLRGPASFRSSALRWAPAPGREAGCSPDASARHAPRPRCARRPTEPT
jgi:hypothetical protein